MLSPSLIGQIAGLISFSAYVLYIVSTLKKETKPNRATWWILTLVGVMIAASYYAEGARDTMWVALSYVVGPFIIALLSLKYGEGTWERLDKICLAVAIVSAFLWYVFNSAFIALMSNIAMDFVGLIPTIKKSWLRPGGEDRVAWGLESGASVLNLLAVQTWTFAIAFYPLYLAVLNTLITVLLFRSVFKKLRN